MQLRLFYEKKTNVASIFENLPLKNNKDTVQVVLVLINKIAFRTYFG